MQQYIYEQHAWPDLRWDADQILSLLAAVRHRQGRLVGRMESLSADLRSEAVTDTLTREIMKSAEIAGTTLDAAQVRIAVNNSRQQAQPATPDDKTLNGMVAMAMDATQNYNEPLTTARLSQWHDGIMATPGTNWFKTSSTGWRKPSMWPRQHQPGKFAPPPPSMLQHEMNRFIQWFNAQGNTDAVVKAAVAHLWFSTIQPYENGNGRIARALTDMLLARADNSAMRFYSMSARMQKELTDYRDVLYVTQCGSVDITGWLMWFLICLGRALGDAEQQLAGILQKADYWDRLRSKDLNTRQINMLEKLINGMDIRLTTARWAEQNQCSHDTALRDIQDLLEKRILSQEQGGGRSTAYMLLANG